jgi:glutamate--cysteine ligase
VLAALEANGNSFERFGLQQSEKHADYFRSRPLAAHDIDYFTNLAKDSLAAQDNMERTQSGNFDAFVASYNQRTPPQLCEESVTR